MSSLKVNQWLCGLFCDATCNVLTRVLNYSKFTKLEVSVGWWVGHHEFRQEATQSCVSSSLLDFRGLVPATVKMIIEYITFVHIVS